MLGMRRRCLRRARAGLVVVLAMTVAGCATVMATMVSPASVRYAVQWHAYLGALRGRPVEFHLALMDRAVTAAWIAPTIENLEVLTDRGPLGARVVKVEPSRATADIHPFTVLGELTPPADGTYVWSDVRYTDEAGTTHRLRVGEWRLDVTSEPGSAIESTSWTLGASVFGYLEVGLQNVGQDEVTIDELEAWVPGLSARSHAFVRPGASGGITAGGIETGDALPFRLPAQGRAVIAADFSGGAPDAFVQLQPYLAYRVGTDPTRHRYDLPLQVYSPTMSPGELTRYLATLPGGASHAIPQR